MLTRVTEFQINDGAARSAFFAAVNTIGSDGDRAEVLSGVLKNPDRDPRDGSSCYRRRDGHRVGWGQGFAARACSGTSRIEPHRPIDT